MDAKKRSNGYTIALPSGKNMEGPTLELLDQVGVTVRRRHPRAIEGEVDGIPHVYRAIFSRPDQVALLVQRHKALFGITGKDVVIENALEDVEIIAELPYSKLTKGGTRCVLFTHHENPITTLDGLKNRREEIKEEESDLGDWSVATEYPVETRAFFKKKGVKIPVISTRSAEVMVYTRVCRYGVALVETGTTRDVNRLVEIEDGTIFGSTAVLVARKDRGTLGLPSDFGYVEPFKFLPALLAGGCKALSSVYLLMNAPVGQIKAILKILPSLKSPTVQPLADLGFCSIGAIVPAKDVNVIIWALREHKATGFVTLPPSIVM